MTESRRSSSEQSARSRRVASRGIGNVVAARALLVRHLRLLRNGTAVPHCILVLWGTAERKIAPEVVVDDDVASAKTIKRDRLISLGIVASIVAGVVFIAQRRLAYDSPMWADEAWTWLVIHRPLGGVAGVVLTDEANMGPYYLGLRLWAMFGESDAWLADSRSSPVSARRCPSSFSCRGTSSAEPRCWPSSCSSSTQPSSTT